MDVKSDYKSSQPWLVKARADKLGAIDSALISSSKGWIVPGKTRLFIPGNESGQEEGRTNDITIQLWTSWNESLKSGLEVERRCHAAIEFGLLLLQVQQSRRCGREV